MAFSSGICGVDSTERRLVSFYKTYKPEKLMHKIVIDEILRRYKGRETKLFEDLHEKYDIENRVNEIYWTYIEKHGEPPKDANQLHAFSLQIGYPIQWIDANHFIQNMSPLSTFSSIQSDINEIRTVYYKYKKQTYSIDVTQKKK
eukprot:713695_1